MENKQKDQTVTKGEQNSSSRGMLGGMSDTVSSVVDGSQSSGDNQSFLSKGELTNPKNVITRPMLTYNRNRCGPAVRLRRRKSVRVSQ